MVGWYCLEYLLLDHWYNVDKLVGNQIQRREAQVAENGNTASLVLASGNNEDAMH